MIKGEQQHIGFLTWYGEPEPFCPHCRSENLNWSPDGYNGAVCADCETRSSEHELAAAVGKWLAAHR